MGAKGQPSRDTSSDTENLLEMSVTYIESKEEKAELQRLKSILQSSYGPLGMGVMLQPSTRGHVTVTSHSQRLLPLLHTSTPVGRLLLDSLHNHTKTHRDSGLHAGLLATDLILRGMELALPRRQVATVTSHALSLITDCLCDESADVGKCRLELSSRQEMMSMLCSLLCTKTAITQLSNAEVDYLASLLLQSFLMVTAKGSSASVAIAERVNVHTCLGRPVEQSRLLTGLLLECPHSDGSERDERLLQGLREGGGGGDTFITALFDVSLAGDLPDNFPSDVELVIEESTVEEMGRGVQNVEAVVMRRLMRVASHLVEMGVRFVGCQKVMHPLLKDYWRDKGVVAIDRLSLDNLGPVRDITGGQIISSLTTGLSPSSLGRLTSIRHTSVLGKRYIVLEGSGGYCSLILCCLTDSVADELRPLCSSALYILQQCLHSPYMLHGGGCLETQLSHFLLTKGIAGCSGDLLDEMQCNEKTFRAVIKSVARSLQSVSVCLEHHGGTVLSDSSSHHCWFFPPEDTSLQPAAGEGGPTRSDGRWSDTGSVKDKRESVRGGCVGPKDRIPHQAASLTRPVSSSEGSGLCSTVYNERWRSLKTCGCGCVRLLDLPPTCKWIPLRDDRLSMYVPDSIKQCLKRPSTEDSSSGQTCGSSKEKLPFPCVCDAFLPKLRAIETAGDLSSTVLRIAFSISEK